MVRVRVMCMLFGVSLCGWDVYVNVRVLGLGFGLGLRFRFRFRVRVMCMLFDNISIYIIYT